MQVAPNRRERRAKARQDARQAKKADKLAPGSLAKVPAGVLAGQSICLSSIFREDDPAVVRRCLESVRPFLTSWAIIDTGCSDEVRATIHDALGSIPGRLERREWPDSFAVARNWALDLARATRAKVALFLDADDRLEPNWMDQDRGRLLYPVLPPIVSTATLMSIDHGVHFRRSTFVRLDAPCHWHGDVHEALITPYPVAIEFDHYVIRCSHDGAASRDFAGKVAYYAQLLRRRVQADAEDVHGWLHLGFHLVRTGAPEGEIRECEERVTALMARSRPEHFSEEMHRLLEIIRERLEKGREGDR